MKKKFVTNLGLVLLLNLLIKPFWIFGIEVKVQNVVGAENYGLYFSLLSFSLIINIVLDLGVTNYNNKNISQHNQLLTKFLSNIIVLKLILAVAYFAISMIAAVIIGYNIVQIKLLLFLVFNQFLISFTLYLRSNLSGLQLYRTDSILSVLDKTIMIIICSFLLWGNFSTKPFRIEWFVYAQTAAYVLSSTIIFLIVFSNAKFLRLKFDYNYLRVIIKQSYPFAILVLIMATYNRIDSVLLERLLENGKEQAGIYAQSFRILDAGAMFGFLFAGLLLPMFSRMLKQKENIGQLLQLSSLLILIPAIILAICSYFYNVEIMDLLYKEHILESSKIFTLLMIGFVGISTTYIFGSLLTANGSLRELNIMASIGLVINIVLNIILIPKYQALGAASSSLATQLFTAVAQIFIVKKKFNFPTNYILIFSILFFIVTIFIFGYVSKLYFTNWIYGFFAIVIFSTLLAFFTKLISVKTLFEIVKGDE
ncbi:MAG: oligosaccharide flippase family protein [Bacteroidetes bacterium]|nr:oligosaccharide flippase family protein [Bacteroidota bacterium]MBT6687769.1 oligosaccharide flippase family protein [Bacteroidota bacterium]MBT7143403.1 oligosaccharide flippase family protein [Bacteroidota bacterium]MBT7492537.1 oligosaccharide flippase family protein [Bacteroidota bacterium]